MCGIVGYVGKKQVVPVIIDGLRRLEYRGYDSAGIAVAGNGDGLQVRRAEGKLRNLEEVIRLKPLDGIGDLPRAPPGVGESGHCSDAQTGPEMDDPFGAIPTEQQHAIALTDPVLNELHGFGGARPQQVTKAGGAVPLNNIRPIAPGASERKQTLDPPRAIRI